MNCKKCGSILSPTDMICRNCGEPVNNTTLNQTNNQINSQPLNINGNFQNNIQQEQTVQTNMSMPNTNSTGFYNNVQQNMGEGFSQNINPQSNGMINNQNIYSETAFQQNNNNMSQPEGKKKNNYIFIIVVVILILVIGFLGYFVVSKKILKNNDDNNLPSNDTSVTEQDKQVNNTNVYNYKNFEFPKLASYEVQDSNNSLTLVNNADKIAIALEVFSNITIDDVREQLDDLKDSFVSNGIEISSDSEKKILGVDWIILNCSMVKSGVKEEFIMGLAALGDYHVAETMIFNYSSKSNDTVLNDLSGMISKATYQGTKDFSPDSEKENITINNFDFDKSIFE